jgi:signal transduction histidine kinase
MKLLSILAAAWRGWWSPYFKHGAEHVGKDSEKPPRWADLLVTFLFNAAIGLVLTAFSWVFSAGRIDFGRTLGINFVVAQCIGFSIHGLFVLAGALIGAERIDGWTGARRTLFFSLVPLAGVVIGYALGFLLVDLFYGRVQLRFFSGWFVAGALMIWAVLSLFWWRFYVGKFRLAEAEKQLAADRARAAELERQALDAQLRALQAQIEPHFLFNTLANVVSLVDAQPASAKRMLERLIDLLRGSLSASRARHATLGQEIDLVRAYLDILSIRMGPRLRYETRIDDGLRALSVPPMLLQPLVENAIQHGLEPKIEGGRVNVTARARDGEVEILVEDDGVGFGAATRGGGVGLSNLRQRLSALSGGRMRLTIEDAGPGTRVRLLIPREAPPAAAADAAQPAPAGLPSTLGA